jgi:hypothetical protein
VIEISRSIYANYAALAPHITYSADTNTTAIEYSIRVVSALFSSSFTHSTILINTNINSVGQASFVFVA